MTPTNILEQLQRDEGLRLFPYLDSVGVKTIGYGHNLQAHPLPDVDGGISIQRATEILSNDLALITLDLTHTLPGTIALDKPRFGVLQNMAFNLGVHGLLGFTSFLAYLQTSQYDNAAAAMLASKWARQVGQRAYRLSEQIRKGTWQ